MSTLSAKKKQAAIDFYNMAKLICPAYNLLAVKAITAQAMCESNWGASKLSAKYYNYFGMKCGSKWTGASVNMATKEEYVVGKVVSIKDNFRAYPSLIEGVRGYCNFITGMSRYKNLLGCKDDIQYIKNIKADGWATSSTYVNTLTSILKNLEANGVFKEQNIVTNNPKAAAQPSSVSATQSNHGCTVGQTYTTTAKVAVFEKADASSKCLKYYAAGTKFTLKEVKDVGNDIWWRTPSGWIPAYYSGKLYVK